MEKQNGIFAFIFDSGRLGSSFYGEVVFKHIMKGKEITKNPCKTVVSLGDILVSDRFIDIEPYVVKDDFCTVDFKNIPEFKDYPFCWVIEDLESGIALQIDSRLRKELEGYVGLTGIDMSSCDIRKQFWKKLIREFSIDNCVITSFQNPDIGDDFCYLETATELEYVVQYDKDAEYAPVEWCESMQSSYVKKEADLAVIDGKKDIDRNLMSLNFMLCRELQIAGALIWKSVNDIDKVNFNRGFLFDNDGSYLLEYSFFALYHASQGVERVQKIVVELICKRDHIQDAEKKKVYELLMSHNHNALNAWIEEKSGIAFKNNHRKIFHMLQKFYNEIRYFRFSDRGDYKTTAPEFKLLLEFGDGVGQDDTGDVIKNQFGKALGSIANTYYKLIYEICGQLNIYAYELALESAASLVFNFSDTPKNLYNELKQMQQSKKELLYWLLKKGEEFPKFSIAGEDALNFDPAMIDEYMEELIKNAEDGHSLYDDTDCLYNELCGEDKKKWAERVDLVDAVIANPSVWWEDDFEDEEDEED